MGNVIWPWLIRSRIARWIGGALAAAAVLAGVILRERRDAASDALREAQAEGMRDALDGIEKGNEAVRNIGDRDPDDVLLGNDGAWR